MSATPQAPGSTTVRSRRHIAQLQHRLMAMAVFPCRLLATNPLPRGFLPKLGAAKAKACLYPDEGARLLASTAIPLWWRVLWGLLNREGPRISEAARLQVQDVDLDRDALRLEKNKTNDPRAWALFPGVPQALRAWLALRGNPAPSAPLFIDEDGALFSLEHAAERLRATSSSPAWAARSSSRPWTSGSKCARTTRARPASPSPSRTAGARPGTPTGPGIGAPS
ncbi:tyrosine-type recombinase/integrase [Sorangium sp. So ce1014]|uniref:tyrosine-type recombinase/integrase n=1 Tax=Sorangium sp. So ce1014 TaxID=3133326 RepID=UPI003F5DBEC2